MNSIEFPSRVSSPKLPSAAFWLGLLLPLPGDIGIGGGFHIAVFIKLAWLVGIIHVRSFRFPLVIWLLVLQVLVSCWCGSLIEPGGVRQTLIGAFRWFFDLSFFLIGAKLLARQGSLSDFSRGVRMGLLLACVYIALVFWHLGYFSAAGIKELAWGDAKNAVRPYIKDWPNYYGIHLASLFCIFGLQPHPLRALWRRPSNLFYLGVILCSVSRSVVLLLAAFFLWQIISQSRNPLLLMLRLSACALLGTALLNTPLLRERILEQTFGLSAAMDSTPFAVDKDVVGRFDRWRPALHLVIDSPIFGYGQRSLSHLSPEIYSSFYGLWQTTGSVHNDYLDMAMRAGIPCVVIFFGFVLWVGYRGMRLARHQDAPIDSVFGSFGRVAVIMMLVGMTGDFYRYEGWISTFWLMAGALWIRIRHQRGAAQTPDHAPAGPVERACPGTTP